MAEIKSGALPQPAAVVTGFDTPQGQSCATALASAGFRLCVVGSVSGGALAGVASLPQHERLHHEAILADLAEPGAAQAAALEARGRLGQLTLLLHVVSPDSEGAVAAAFDARRLARDIQLGAGAFLALGLGLLPDMLATQTGCLCVLTAAPAAESSFAQAPLGAAASLGALLGAVRQLADRCAGTPLRSILLSTEAAQPGALSAPALAALLGEVGAQPGPQPLQNGWFLGLGPAHQRGPIQLMRPPPTPAPSRAPSNGSTRVAGTQPSRSDRVGEKLAQTFRATFGLAPDADISGCAVGKLARWDSLGHLKLMMEVEQALRVRLPAEALSRIQSYRDLEKAVRAQLPAQ
jgi:acyl carrier protein/NAD(P)-dependent dehydrogenase (short-subunit alcohol dehydrogenase family)